jgi:Uma2 family endonuclease
MDLQRKRFTRDELHRIEESGVLEGRYELIDGDLIQRIGQTPTHAYALRGVYTWMAHLHLSVRCPIEVATADRQFNEPEPDIAILREFKPEYRERHPRGDELTLVIEIADSSSRFDLTIKAALYARAAVPEYWVLDLTRRVLVIHRDPQNGAYSRIEQLAEQLTVTLEDHSILISDLLG